MHMVTYEKMFCQYCCEKGSTSTTKKVIKYALNRWCSYLEIDSNSNIGEEFLSDFSSNLDTFRSLLIKTLAKDTVSSVIARVKTLQQFFRTSLAPQSIESFPEKLRRIMEINEISASTLSKLCNIKISARTIVGWQTKICKRLSNIPAITEIEKVLNLAPNELLSSLPLTYLHKTHIKKTHSKKKYRNIPGELLSVFKDEIEKLTHFKSASLIFFDINRKGSWTPDSTGNIASKIMYEQIFLRFANFLVNNHYICRPEESRAKGENKYDTLTMGLFCEKQLVNDFIWSTYEESNSKFNNGHLTSLSIISSLLRVETGYLFQNSSFAEKIGLNISADQWRERCLSTRDHLLKLRRRILLAEKDGSEEFAFGRDPEARIKWILELDDPLKPISDMIKLMTADLPKFSFSAVEQAKHFQNILLVALIQHNPLRVSMFAKMKFGENLFKADDGRWWLQFRRSEFKNRAFLKTDYRVMVNPSLSPLIDVFYNNYYPLLTDDTKSNFVFLKRVGGKKNVGRSAREISELLEFLSRCYIPGCEGFCGHSYRHIVTTAIIRKKPNQEGISDAAAALHDSPKTVEQRYAHLKSNDFYAPVNRFSTDLYEKHGLLDTFTHLTKFHVKSEVRYGE